MIDVDPHVGDHLGGDVLAVFLDIGHPVVRCICLARAMSQQQNRRRRYQGLGDLAPVLWAVVLVGALGVPGAVVNLVEAATWIGGGKVLRPLAGRRISGIDSCVAEVDDRDDILAPDKLYVLDHGQTSRTSSISSPDRTLSGTGQRLDGIE